MKGLRRLSPTTRDLAEILIEDAKHDVRNALEMAVRLANEQTPSDVREAMGLSPTRYDEVRKRVRRAGQKLG